MATKRTRAWPDEAIRPGETLSEELAARGMSQSALAKAMDRPVQVINEIVLGKKQITAETALQLEAALGVSAEMWMALESNYQLTKARLKAEGLVSARVPRVVRFGRKGRRVAEPLASSAARAGRTAIPLPSKGVRRVPTRAAPAAFKRR
jgi:addiction module HigA family antidote